MSNDLISLKLQIGQKTISLTTNIGLEYYYKTAEKIINDKLLEFAKKWNYTDHQDLLSKLLLDFVVKWIENEERLNEMINEIVPMMEQLNTLADNLDVKNNVL